MSDDVFRTLFASYPDALIVAGARGEIVLANPAAESLLGYAAGELVGLNVDALVPDAIRSRHASYREAYGRTPRARPMGAQVELVAKRRDGSEVMVEIALSPLQGQGLPLVVAAIRGIGEYPRVKQALRRARYAEHLAQLGRLAVDARDPQHLVQEVPAIAARALDVEFARVLLVEPNGIEFRVAGCVGDARAGSVGERVALESDRMLAELMTRGESQSVADYEGGATHASPFAPSASARAAGVRSALAVPLLDRGRVVGALTARSRTPLRFGDDERRFMESLATLLATSLQRAQSEDALKHAQRLESVGQLTGGIAHDFNNLLTVIQGNLQVLEELPALEQQAHAQQLVGAAMRAARRGAELTSKLLAFSSRQVLQPMSVDTAALLQSLTGMLRRTLDQRIRIELDVAADCPHVLADAGQLESALLNIAINARDAMPEGGTLRFSAVGGAQAAASMSEGIRTELAELSEAAHAENAGFVALTITDDGSGMSDEVKTRAFEPFFTTKEAGRGTGLGLSTVYGFAKQSGGAVSIRSEMGLGTSLTLYIPEAEAASTVQPRDDAQATAIPPGLRVLLVEDDSEVRAVVLGFLRTLGCEVVEAASGERALQMLDEQAHDDPMREAPQLLLTDIALGAGMRGTELAHRVAERLPEIGVLLMSGYSAELIDADRDSPPSWDLLRKPYTREELANAIARVLAGES